MFLGSFADQTGRRPTYIICFIIYIASNIGLALQDSYAALIVLRCVQSAGISSTVALSAATVADIAPKSERGSSMGFVMSGTFVSQSVGPIIGGLLAQYLGWRSIFWFLTIAAGAFFIPLLFFMPETARHVIGDGSLPPQSWNRPLVEYVYRRATGKAYSSYSESLSRDDNSRPSTSDSTKKPRPKFQFPNPIKPLVLVFNRNSLIVLFVTGVVMAANMTVLSSITSIYTDLYGLNVLEIGLCYISMGSGSVAASIITGKFLDITYRRYAAKGGEKSNDDSVPVEKARSVILIPLVLMGVASVLAFGWVLEFGVHLAAPESIMFFSGLGLTGGFICASTLLVDLHTSSPAAATASNNLVRSLFSAAASAAIDPMLTSLGRGWAFTIIGLILLGTVPFLFVLGWMGRLQAWMGGRKKDPEQAEA